MTEWRETKSANLKDIKSIGDIIGNLRQVKGFLEQQIKADSKNVAETQAQIEKLKKGRVE